MNEGWDWNRSVGSLQLWHPGSARHVPTLPLADRIPIIASGSVVVYVHSDSNNGGVGQGRFLGGVLNIQPSWSWMSLALLMELTIHNPEAPVTPAISPHHPLCRQSQQGPVGLRGSSCLNRIRRWMKLFPTNPILCALSSEDP